MVKIRRLHESGYRAWCPALPGCVVFGTSEQDANDRIRQAVDGYMASLNESLPRELANLVRHDVPGSAHAA
jgi:predicted RNase H-like HicB family nuclease